ncbi:thioredoxin domain-containing protein [Caproiciproducens galactitolivorans]|nr:thioredoxin domain-containing protein [Caproiciproducens galactitolivorans]QEY34785.1 thioredoxin domain-containing protein [Caproiciproducens galactitolivorans]
MNTNRVPNRLINEKSPYLLQHAYNPVNWFPWGKEAFEVAKREKKPIFLSSGYSTCHWCHVMEHESFEDAEVAERLNRDFVCIKVDREERPDVDAVYMEVCQVLTGSGGWPLTILMTPEQQPFFAGTYFPKKGWFGTVGLLDLLDSAAQQWRENREKIIRSGKEITDAIREREEKKAGRPSKQMIHLAKQQLSQSFDTRNGGFGRSPKFPSPQNLLFLLRFAVMESDEQALSMVEKTLRQMYRGGIFDHIGYGFSRYSTDEKWLVPHFEKMLYDNALLTMAYLETYQITGIGFYKMVAMKVMDYVLREMTDIGGGFYSAQDADSEGKEGKYYVFSPGEILTLLGEEDGQAFNRTFHITEEGNFEGKSIPNLLGQEEAQATEERIASLIPRVYQYRKERTELRVDDKILTSWNALMIAAFAKAYRILGDSQYLDAAEKAMRFLTDHLMDKNGNLLIRWREGEAAGTGGLDDYAFSIWALLNLYEATFDVRYLKLAVDLYQKMTERFYDRENGGFFLSSNEAEPLIYRPKETYDGAIPSGNSVAAAGLLKLFALTGDTKLREAEEEQLQFLAATAQDYPAGYCFALLTMMSALYPSKEIVCIIRDKAEMEPLKALLRKKILFNTTVIVKNAENAEQLEQVAPFTKAYALDREKSAYFVCENNVCAPPVYTLEELEKLL